MTEDRQAFAKALEGIDVSKTKSVEVNGYQELVDAMISIGFPVIIRPSFVIGGESMFIFNKHDDIHELPTEIKKELQNGKLTFLVETYLQNAIEYDVDLIRDRSGHCIFTVSEHIEHAGVHSGDSGMITPPVHINHKTYEKLKNVSIQIAMKLDIVGPINIQFAIIDDSIYCIEANPRGSRTLPFLSKCYDLSLPDLSVKAMVGHEIPDFDTETMNYYCVKQATFPFDRFPDDNIILGPKMLSTGETMGVDTNKNYALLKSYLGNHPNLGAQKAVLISLSDQVKPMLLPYLNLLTTMGYDIFATAGTAHFIKKQGLPCQVVSKISEGHIEAPSMIDLIQSKKISIVFNTPHGVGQSDSDGKLIRQHSIQNQIPCFTRPENIKTVLECLIVADQASFGPIALQDLPHVNT